MKKTFLLFISFFSFCLSAQQDAKSVLTKMIEKCATIKTMQAKISNKERVFDVIKHTEGFAKMAYDPFRFYMKQSNPRAGLEVLYVQGERGNNAIINPNGFPWMNVTLSPYGNMIHLGTHHTLFHVGYKYFSKIANYYMSIAVVKPDLILEADEKIGSTLCYKVTFDMKNYSFITHTVKKGETIHSIADKYMVNSNSILERNIIVVDDYEETLYEGEKLIVPNCYGKKITMWIEKSTYLPVLIKVFDDKGFYESYEYREVKINIPFKPDEFTESFDDYNF